jgi:acetylxylan esterase
MNLSAKHVLMVASLLAGLLMPAPLRAASMQKVNQSDWWAGVTGLPSYVNMYIYVPDTPASKPPIVVVPHHCQGSASSSNSESASLETIANKNGFIIIFPEATGQNCWDAGSTRSLKHDGKGDTHAIAQMVRYTITKHNADASRVYSVGGSSGGIMTEALLGVYPDIFMAGVSLMGVPCGCWAEQYNDITGTGSTAQWSGPCSGGTVTKTGQQWGDLVRSYFPGYTGHRPRLQHWHGTSDTVLNYKVMAEDIKEWTNLLGLSETPTGTDTPKSGTTRQYWKNSCGYTVYETFSMSGVAHAVPFDATAVAAYFGLDKAGGQDPEAVACPGTGGTGGAGGSTGTGGTTSAGGTGGSGDGGPGGRDGGPDLATRTGGSTGSGGRTGSGGAAGTGGTAGSGGSSGSGGTSSNSSAGGAGGDGGAAGSGGTSAQGGTTGSGGTAGSGGSSATTGSGGAAEGGQPGSGGTSGQGGNSGSGGSKPVENPSASGCTCGLASHTGHGRLATVMLFVAVVGLLLRRRKRHTF